MTEAGLTEAMYVLLGLAFLCTAMGLLCGWRERGWTGAIWPINTMMWQIIALGLMLMRRA